jgi:glycosyltransferase involved in cell wall biosynthesis
MKIASITNDIDSGGAAKSLSILATELAALGHEVHIISTCRPSRTTRRVEALVRSGVQVSYVSLPYYPMSLVACPIPFWKNAFRALKAMPRFMELRRIIAAIDPDVIHYNSYVTLLAALALPGRPSVLHAREALLEDAPLLPLTEALVRSRIREIIAISPLEHAMAERHFGLRTTTVYNSAMHPPEAAAWPESEGLVYAMFSHVSPMKGHRFCIEACAEAADALRKNNVTIRMFGGRIPIHAALYDELKHGIRGRGLEDVVNFEGFAADSEAEIRNTHLLLRPDLSASPWGRDVIEAMSLGRPVLALGTARTFVRPGVTGELVANGDVKGFARAMVDLADRDRLRTMGDNALAFARENFDPSMQAAKVSAVLERVAAYAPSTS